MGQVSPKCAFEVLLWMWRVALRTDKNTFVGQVFDFTANPRCVVCLVFVLFIFFIIPPQADMAGISAMKFSEWMVSNAFWVSFFSCKFSFMLS